MWRIIFSFLIFSLIISFYLKFVDGLTSSSPPEGLQVSLPMKSNLVIKTGTAYIYKNKQDYLDKKHFYSCELSNINKHCFFYGTSGSLKNSINILEIKDGYFNFSGKHYSMDGLVIRANPFNVKSKSYKTNLTTDQGDLYRVVFTFWSDVVFRAKENSNIWTNSFDMLVWFSEDDYAPMNTAWRALFSLALDISKRNNSELVAVMPMALRDMSDSKIDGLCFGEKIQGWNLTPADDKKLYSFYTQWAKKYKKGYDKALKGIEALKKENGYR